MVELSLIKALLSGEPYCGPALMADADSGHMASLAMVADRLHTAGHAPRVLEIGCWLGATTLQLAALLDARFADWALTCQEDFHPPLHCASLHPKAPDSLLDGYAQAAQTGVLPGLLAHNLHRSPHCSRIRRLDAPLEAALAALPDAGFDLVLVHGPRTLGQVGPILDQCLRLCAPGGLICGTGLAVQRHEAEPVGLANGFRSRHITFHLYCEASGKRYYPELTWEIAERFGRLHACGDFWAIERRPGADAVSLPLPPGPPAARAEAAAEQYGVTALRDGRYAVLHHSIPASRLGNERLGEREIPELLEFADTPEAAARLAAGLEERRRRRKGVVLEKTRHYYLCKYGADTYLAQSTFLDRPRGFRVFAEVMGEQELAPLLLRAASLQELRRKVAGHEAAIDAGRQALPILERYQGYYLYDAGQGQCVAVHLDVQNGRPFRDYIGLEELAPYVLLAADMETLKVRIARMGRRDADGQAREAAPEQWL